MSRYLRLTRGQPGKLDGLGLEPLRLALWEEGREVAHLTAYSGARGAQTFRTLAHEVAGELEPIPEGVYTQLGELDFAGGAGNWTTRHPEVDSPLWVTIYPRRAIGFHLDGNRAHSPGSAGCVVVATLDDLRTLASWWHEGRPERLEVDWGLGTVPKPVTPAKAAPAPATAQRFRVLAWGHPKGNRVRIPAGLVPGDYAVSFFGGDGGAASLVLERLA